MDSTETGMTSTTIDTTSTNKRRELPPLNVYVRIRPFIGDELERGENQKLLDIIDQKHIAVKVYPTINNTIRNIQASYNEYEVGEDFRMQRRFSVELFDIIDRSLEYLIIAVHRKTYSNKLSNNPPMKSSQVRIGFFVHLV